MKCLWIISIHFLFFIGSTYGSMFVPLPLDEQLKESDGVVWGTYLGHSYKRLPKGEVVTIGSFKVKKQAGLRYQDLLNRNKIDVIYPGGVWQGIEYDVLGSPSFNKKEEVLLFVKRTGLGFVIQNLSLGKYKVSKSRNDINFHSTVFTNHPKLGSFSLDHLNDLLLERFNANLEIIPSFSVSIGKRDRAIDRRIASFDEDHSGISTEEIPMVGLGVFLILLGVSRKKIFRIWKRFL